ncbi:MAG: C45 family peptidase [Planctomycetaceae bacterium]
MNFICRQMLVLLVVCVVLGGTCVRGEERITSQGAGERLSGELSGWVDCLTGGQERFSITGSCSPVIDGKPQEIHLRLVRFDAESFDLELTHADYALTVQRRLGATAMVLPKHRKVFLAKGEARDIDPVDQLKPLGLLDRIITPNTRISQYATFLNATPREALAGVVTLALNLTYNVEQQAWTRGDQTTFVFQKEGRHIIGNVNGTTFQLTREEIVPQPQELGPWEGLTVETVERREMERQLARGARRTLEVLVPSSVLTAPVNETREVPHGKLIWVEGQRVALLAGTPEQIGTAHGQLLKAESIRCIDSVMHAFGTVQTILTGRWFRKDLDAAYAQLSPHIPERHKVETRALAKSLDLDPHRLEVLNVFPELFHCSGFALFGSATEGGKLYHGRVLDYMTTIGLQDSATTFVIVPEGYIPFANVGYGGFVGCVSGMNAEQISLGEMGGRGEGQWNGVPMATLMRRALEECDSLDEVKQLWSESPRTCEYYYVFADGQTRQAVGVAATPHKIEFVLPGQGHELLGDGIPDAVVLSAGSRLEKLRARVQEKHGSINAEVAMWLMSRPVAMQSNLHNVLFVPEDGLFYVANASHRQPAAERPYVKFNLRELMELARKLDNTTINKITSRTKLPARDTLNVGEEKSGDARLCLDGLCWKAGEFSVTFEETHDRQGDWLVRFPSPIQTGNDRNDLVAMEWYMATDKQGHPVTAPAVVVVHESGSKMAVGRLIARNFQSQGIHAFMLQLPHYGVRRGDGPAASGATLIPSIRQAVADVRRARDAVAVIPGVDRSRVSLQGTSLGGFVSATTAGLDRGYDKIFLFLAGGDLADILANGKKDAAKMRERLAASGFEGEKLSALLNTIEPTRLAHRLDPTRTWLYSGQYDDVVPSKNAALLAKKANLAESHHIEMLADHYSGVVYLPFLIKQMSVEIRDDDRK